MSEAEVGQFEQLPYFQDAVQLRRFDDAAKIVGFKTPPVDHFVPLIRQVTKPRPATVTP
jgi:predicted HD phosphohydrolase